MDSEGEAVPKETILFPGRVVYLVLLDGSLLLTLFKSFQRHLPGAGAATVEHTPLPHQTSAGMSTTATYWCQGGVKGLKWQFVVLQKQTKPPKPSFVLSWVKRFHSKALRRLPVLILGCCVWQPPKLILMYFRYCTDSTCVVSDTHYFVNCIRDFKANRQTQRWGRLLVILYVFMNNGETSVSYSMTQP